MKHLLALAFWFFAASVAASEQDATDSFVLSETCPPSFALENDGTCGFVSLYMFYDTPPQHGGLRAQLAPPQHAYTPAQIDLGRYLFFDPALSGTGTLSCASCHAPEQGFADGRAKAVGKAKLARGAPSLWNIGLNTRFMWDGRAQTLEEQALMPIYNPDEMANSPEGLQAALDAAPAYAPMFQKAFGRRPDPAGVATALAAFQSTLISLNSRYDRYAHGDASALTVQEVRGYNAFRGFVARCSQCHIPPLFTDNELSVVGSPPDAEGNYDLGAGTGNNDPFLQGAFKVPTLRNITLSAPYFHAGQFQTLTEVTEFYNETRGHALDSGVDREIHWHVHMTQGPKLSKQNVQDIVAFLATLEDETMRPITPAAVPSGLPVVDGPAHIQN